MHHLLSTFCTTQWHDSCFFGFRIRCSIFIFKLINLNYVKKSINLDSRGKVGYSIDYVFNDSSSFGYIYVENILKYIHIVINL